MDGDFAFVKTNNYEPDLTNAQDTELENDAANKGVLLLFYSRQ